MSKHLTAEELVRDGVVTPKEAAALLSCSLATVYEMMSKSELPFTRVRADRRIPRRAIALYLARRLTSGR